MKQAGKKTIRFNMRSFAVAACGWALLFGAGVAPASNHGPEYAYWSRLKSDYGPVDLAVETIPATREVNIGEGSLQPNFWNVSLLAADGYWVRFAVDGAVFRGTLSNYSAGWGTAGTPAWTSQVAAGGAGENWVVYKLGGDTPQGMGTTVSFQNSLKVLNANPGNLSITTTFHTDQFDAIEGRNALSAKIVPSGTIVFVRKVEGLQVQVDKGTAAVADVSTEPVGFLWFLNNAGNAFTGGNTGTTTSGPNTSNVKLGFARAGLRPGVLVDARDGTQLVLADVMDTSGYSVTVEGDLSIGALDLVKQTGTAPNLMVPCTPRRGSMSSPGMGDIGPPSSTDTTPGAQTVPVTRADAGSHYLCLEVDNKGANTNRTPIKAQDFNATVAVTPATAGLPVKKVQGVIGRIVRNGASVEIPYLTASPKYNQRLIILNRGPTAAVYELGGFTTEPGTGLMVDLSDAAKAARANGQNQVPAGGQVVLRVADLLKFTGSDLRRAGAVLNVNAFHNNIQVATTQVNTKDGSTDTVVYAAQDSLGVVRTLPTATPSPTPSPTSTPTPTPTDPSA